MKWRVKSYFSILEYFHFFLISLFGTLLHFTFNWFHQNKLVASFSAVNESVWEHLKLVFFPMLFTTIIGCFLLLNYFPGFLCSRVLGILAAILFITVFFYTYTGIIGKNFAVLDIGSFFVAVFLGEYVSYYFTSSAIFYCSFEVCNILLSILLLCFVIFTYFPPHLNYFKDPITQTYGIYQKKK